MSGYIISWIDGGIGVEVRACTVTQEAAMEVASCMSVGGDATVELNQKTLKSTWKFENGVETDYEAGPIVFRLEGGWKVHTVGHAVMLTTPSGQTHHMPSDAIRDLFNVMDGLS